MYMQEFRLEIAAIQLLSKVERTEKSKSRHFEKKKMSTSTRAKKKRAVGEEKVCQRRTVYPQHPCSAVSGILSNNIWMRTGMQIDWRARPPIHLQRSQRIFRNAPSTSEKVLKLKEKLQAHQKRSGAISLRPDNID